MKSAFFHTLQLSWNARLEQYFEKHSILAAFYMLIVLPLFLLLFLAVTIGAIPGLLLHSLAWGRVAIQEASERTKIAHDMSFLTCAATSAVLAFVYVFPLFAGLGDQPCPLGPIYC